MRIGKRKKKSERKSADAICAAELEKKVAMELGLHGNEEGRRVLRGVVNVLASEIKRRGIVRIDGFGSISWWQDTGAVAVSPEERYKKRIKKRNWIVFRAAKKFKEYLREGEGY